MQANTLTDANDAGELAGAASVEPMIRLRGIKSKVVAQNLNNRQVETRGIKPGRGKEFR